jgi:hypothetical protein
MFKHPLYRLFSWLLLAAYMGLIFWLSSKSVLPVAMDFPYEDKLIHFCAYAIMGFLAAHAMAEGSHKRRFWIAFVIASLYGVTDEFHQYFVPGRECDFGDWLADACGAWVGAYIYLKSESSWRRTV